MLLPKISALNRLDSQIVCIKLREFADFTKMAAQTIMASAGVARLGSKPSLATRPAAFAPAVRSSVRSRQALNVRASDGEKAQVVQPINGDPFIGMLETPVTSAPIVANFLSSLPAYRTGVSPLLRGVEVGLVHGLILTGKVSQIVALSRLASWCRQFCTTVQVLSSSSVPSETYQDTLR